MIDTTVHAGVLDSFNLMWVDATEKLHRVHTNPAFNFGDICQLGITHNLRNIWIVPGSTIANDIAQHPDMWIAYPRVSYNATFTTREHNKMVYPAACFIHRTEGSWEDKRTVNIFYVEADDRWQEDKSGGWALADCEDAMVLLGALKYLHEQLEIDIESPGNTGLKLMKQSLERFPEKIAIADLSKLPPMVVAPYLWERELTPEEKGMKYKHIFDKRSAWLAGATGAELGHGSPKFQMAGGDERPNFKRAGVWQVAVRSLPDVFKFGKTPLVDGSLKWMYNHSIDALLSMGCELWPVQGYYWEKSTRALNDWAKDIWDSRAILSQPGTPFKNNASRETAYKMLKCIYTHGLQRLDLTSDRQKKVKPALHRPDWHNAIVDCANARMLLKINEMYQKHGVIPAKVKTDAITYYSNEPDAQTFLPEMFVRYGQLGSFQCETVEV